MAPPRSACVGGAFAWVGGEGEDDMRMGRELRSNGNAAKESPPSGPGSGHRLGLQIHWHVPRHAANPTEPGAVTKGSLLAPRPPGHGT